MVKILTKKESRGPVPAVLKLADLACKMAGNPYSDSGTTCNSLMRNQSKGAG